MNDQGLKYTGAPSWEELNASSAFPDDSVRRRGPLAIIECIEQIPCNPCESACPKGAIRVGDPITNLPKVDAKLCVGCGLCVAKCPGLAIYVKDYTHGETTATLSFPFEYYPLPKAGMQVQLVGRHGEAICEGTICKVVLASSADHTAVVTASFDKTYFDDVVSMRRLPREDACV